MEITKETIVDIEESISTMLEKKAEITNKKFEIQEKLSSINTAIRTGGRLPDHQYKSLCDQQHKLKSVMRTLEQSISEINTEIRKKNTLRERAKNGVVGSVNDNLVEQLTHLKNHYINFAADGSRVSSMRKMAAEFAEKIEDIISDFN